MAEYRTVPTSPVHEGMVAARLAGHSWDDITSAASSLWRTMTTNTPAQQPDKETGEVPPTGNQDPFPGAPLPPIHDSLADKWQSPPQEPT